MSFKKGLPKGQNYVADAPAKPATLDMVDVAPVNLDDEMAPPTPLAAPRVSAPPHAAPVTYTMTAADIANLVNAARGGADNSAIADAISQGLVEGLAQHMGPRQKRPGDIKETTPFNPEGKKRELKREFFQCGAPILERCVSDQEIELLHKLVDGTYGTAEFPIFVHTKKRLGNKDRTWIDYDGSKDGRNRLKDYGRSFHEILANLVKQAEEQKVARKAALRAELAEA